MSGPSRVAYYLAVALLVIATTIPRTALAQGPKGQSIHVLAIDSDDADEQADALTMALRSHVRLTAGWSLLETTQSLSMLTAAFQCPQHPDATCLTRIGDKLKADQFLWGVMSKAAGHLVTVEVHWWARGKPDHVAHETFSDNMKDSNDDSLRKVATQVFGKLLAAAAGTLVLHASADGATLVVDGDSKGTLDHGRITLTLAAGPHAIELQASGFVNTHRDVTILPSGTSELEVIMDPDGSAAPLSVGGKPLPIRKIVGWSAIAAGGILVATGVGFGVAYLGDQSDLDKARAGNYGVTGTTKAITDPCNPGTTFGSRTVAGCNAVNAAHSAEIGEITTLSIGAALAAVGVFLLVTDHGAEASPAPAAKTSLSRFKLAPSFGPGQGSMAILGSF